MKMKKKKKFSIFKEKMPNFEAVCLTILRTKQRVLKSLIDWLVLE